MCVCVGGGGACERGKRNNHTTADPIARGTNQQRESDGNREDSKQTSRQVAYDVHVVPCLHSGHVGNAKGRVCHRLRQRTEIRTAVCNTGGNLRVRDIVQDGQGVATSTRLELQLLLMGRE